jgi:hypothetical protein
MQTVKQKRPGFRARALQAETGERLNPGCAESTRFGPDRPIKPETADAG